jgi:hypothetical protein
MPSSQRVEATLRELLTDRDDDTLCKAYDITTADGERYEVQISRVVSEEGSR